MDVTFNKKLVMTDFDGEALKSSNGEKQEDVVLGETLVLLLRRGPLTKRGEGEAPDEIFDRYEVMKKIHDAEEEVTVTSEDIDLMIKLIGSSAAVGLIDVMLAGRMKDVLKSAKI